MERILLLEDDKSLVTGLTAALLAAEYAAWAVCPALCLPLLPALCCTVHCIPG